MRLWDESVYHFDRPIADTALQPTPKNSEQVFCRIRQRLTPSTELVKCWEFHKDRLADQCRIVGVPKNRPIAPDERTLAGVGLDRGAVKATPQVTAQGVGACPRQRGSGIREKFPVHPRQSRPVISVSDTARGQCSGGLRQVNRACVGGVWIRTRRH